MAINSLHSYNILLLGSSKCLHECYNPSDLGVRILLRGRLYCTMNDKREVGEDITHVPKLSLSLDWFKLCAMTSKKKRGHWELHNA